MTKANLIHLDEKNHVENPFLSQLEALSWEVLRLEMGNGQTPQQTQRSNFDQVLMPQHLQAALKRINPWMNDQQVQEAIHDLSTFEHNNLYQNNQKILNFLINGTKIQRQTPEGLRYEDVFFIDFDTPTLNSFLAVSQFKIHVSGTDTHIYPDIVCFVNGIPVVVVECKSPKVQSHPIGDAISDLMDYLKQSENPSKQGSVALAYYNQFIVATCRSSAKFGTVTTNIEKHFYRWTDPYPETIEELADYCQPQKSYFVDESGNDDEALAVEIRTSPNDQQRLVHGMLKPENLLSIIRTFSVWTETDDGKMIKVVGRYQQFRAAKKTIEKLLTGKNRDERGGIIWHTQGSGKSLTMVFLIREMYLYPTLQTYKVVLLTDRTQLDEQIKTTAQSAGYTVNNPANITDLKSVLKNNNSEIVSAMIHKFQERDLEISFPELNTSDKIIILTDEAHRSQYSKLGSNLDKALPNATRIAFTGTPIIRTEQTYGEYIDKYTMRQAIKDGVTLEIVYEGRTHDATIDDTQGADKKFRDVFQDYDVNQQIEILAYGTRKAYLEATETIKEKAKDMLRHYVTHIRPSGYKAQVVTVSKEAAHRYSVAFAEAIQELLAEIKIDNPFKITVEDLENLQTAVVISDAIKNDTSELKQYADGKARKLAIAGFKLKFGKTEKVGGSNKQTANGNIGILIVVDMLLTGFDAPIEQVMYLDKVIVNHNLLQAIARVNRVYDANKHVGFVVDYVGMGNHLKKALDASWGKEQEEITECLLDTSSLFAELRIAHETLLKVFTENGLSVYKESEDIYNMFHDEDVRYKYMEAFNGFAKALDNVYPRKEALEYLPELNSFAAINALAARHCRDRKINMNGVSAKLRKVTDEYLKSKGIETKVEPISIMDDKFFDTIKTHKRTRTKAAAIEHAIREIININLNDDPELYASFAEELARILTACKDNWDEIYRLLEELRKRMKASQEEDTKGLNLKTQMPIYRKLHTFAYDNKENLTDDEVNNLLIWTKDIHGMLKVELILTGFWKSTANVNKLSGEIHNYLALLSGQVFTNRKIITSEIMFWAKDDSVTSSIIYQD